MGEEVFGIRKKRIWGSLTASGGPALGVSDAKARAEQEINSGFFMAWWDLGNLSSKGVSGLKEEKIRRDPLD